MGLRFKTTIFVKLLPLQLAFASVIGFSCQIQCQNPHSYGIRKVVIDAGHGGKDPGTVGRKSQEKDIALAIALKLGYYIEKNFDDVTVIYTRNDDRFIPLDQRSKIANDAGADLFISIHCNANPNKTPYGTETYVMGLHRSSDNLDVAMRENAVITYEEDYNSKYEGYDPNSSESYIIFTLMQNAFLDQSLNFASTIQTDFRERANRKDRGVKQAGFLVLWKTSMPSVLVEVGYLSNPKEEEFLSTKSGQDYIASSIFRAFKQYKTDFDSRNSLIAKNQFVSSQESSPPMVPDKNPGTTQSNEPQRNETIAFKVQITSSSKRIPITSSYFKSLQDVEELKIDGVFKYLVGNKESYAEIVEYCQKIRADFPDAFIVALKGGKTIPIDKALRELSN